MKDPYKSVYELKSAERRLLVLKKLAALVNDATGAVHAVLRDAARTEAVEAARDAIARLDDFNVHAVRREIDGAR